MGEGLSGSLERLLGLEIVQRREEGCDVGDLEDRLAIAAEENEAEKATRFESLWNELAILEPAPSFPYAEPSDLESIRDLRPDGPRDMALDLSEGDYLDRVYGAWLGRCAGCLLGKPVEGWPRERIEGYLELAGEYPLEDYFPEVAPLPEGYVLHPSHGEAMRGRIDGMARDDDTDYTILGLHVLEEHGLGFTTEDVADEWLSHLPYSTTYTAERATYKNLVNGLTPPKTATKRNPYREWIGAQIRADVWGYVAPGNPEYAAGLAHRDARLSHIKNGIYGEMFAAAMVSAAFATRDIREIIEIGLSEITEKSRLAEAARDVLAWSGEHGDWREAWGEVMAKYGGYHWVHTINNAAFVLLGLLYGGGDLGKSISIAVMAGFDTDCNGATVGSIVGAMLGARRLPGEWVEPLRDRVRSIVAGFDNSRISDLAVRTCDIGARVIQADTP